MKKIINKIVKRIIILLIDLIGLSIIANYKILKEGKEEKNIFIKNNDGSILNDDRLFEKTDNLLFYKCDIHICKNEEDNSFNLNESYINFKVNFCVYDYINTKNLKAKVKIQGKNLDFDLQKELIIEKLNKAIDYIKNQKGLVDFLNMHEKE